MDDLYQACRVRVIGGVAFATILAGPLGPRELRLAADETVRQVAGCEPLVYVADFRAAVWRLGAADLDALLDGADPLAQQPAAMVVAERDYATARAHAWNVAQYGILRKVFTDYRRAVAWALTRAELVSPSRTAP